MEFYANNDTKVLLLELEIYFFAPLKKLTKMKVYLFHLYRFQIELFHREKVIGVCQGGVASSDDDGEGGDKEEDGEGGVGGGDKEIGERHPEWD